MWTTPRSIALVQRYAPELEKRGPPHLKATGDSWRVDETSVKVKGSWTYLYRAVDSLGNTLNFFLSTTRDAQAAKHLFHKVLAAPHTVPPRVITVDKNACVGYLGHPFLKRGKEISADRSETIATFVSLKKYIDLFPRSSLLVGRSQDVRKNAKSSK